jgi:hypothetical protein
VQESRALHDLSRVLRKPDLQIVQERCGQIYIAKNFETILTSLVPMKHRLFLTSTKVGSSQMTIEASAYEILAFEEIGSEVF